MNQDLCAYGGAFGREVGEGRTLLHAFSSRGSVKIRIEVRRPQRLGPASSRMRKAAVRSKIAADDLESVIWISWASGRPLEKFSAILTASPAPGGLLSVRAERTAQPTTPESKSSPPLPRQPKRRQGQGHAHDPTAIAWGQCGLGSPQRIGRRAEDNRAVSNLAARDFEVYEDGVRQTIERFAEVDRPFHVLVLLDTSGARSPSSIFSNRPR